jgi:hypothetical protein
MSPPCRSLLFAAFLAFPHLPAVEAQTPRGPEIAVTAVDATSEFVTGAAVATNGDFLLAWTAMPPEGPSRVRFRLFRADGTPRTAELGVGTPPWSQFGPRVAMRGDGRFVVVWTEQVPGHLRVLARRFGAGGAPLGPPFRLTPNLRGNQRDPDVAIAAGGGFVATWSSDHIATLPRHRPDIFARRFSSVGKPLGPEFLVNTETDEEQRRPRVAAAADGDFVIAWDSWITEFYDVRIQRFAANGTRRGDEFSLETEHTIDLSQIDGAVAMAPDGGFMAVCTDYLGDFDRDEDPSTEAFPYLGVVGRRVAADGAFVGPPIHVNGAAAGRQQRPNISRRLGGLFVVWESTGATASSQGIFGRRLAPDGTPLGGDIRISAKYGEGPVVALDAQGRGIVAWSEYNLFFRTFRILARRIVQRNPA